MNTLPDKDRMDVPQEELVERLEEKEKLVRTGGLVFIGGCLTVATSYLATFVSRMVLWPFAGSGSTSWVSFLLAEFLSPWFYLAAIFSVLAVGFFGLFFVVFSTATLNLKAYKSPLTALTSLVGWKTLAGLCFALLGTVSFFLAACLTVDSSFLFSSQDRWIQSKFVFGFLAFMVSRLVHESILGQATALKFPAEPAHDKADCDSGKGKRKNNKSDSRSLSDLFSLGDMRSICKETFDHLVFYLIAVSIISGFLETRNEGVYAGLVQMVSFFLRLDMLARSFVFALVFAWLRISLFRVYTVFFTSIYEFAIFGPGGVPSSGQVNLHEALHPCLADAHMWVRYLAFADLRYLAKHSSSRRALVFDPAINGQAFDRVCLTVLANVDRETAKWEALKQQPVTFAQQLPRPQMVPSEPSPWLLDTPVPEGIRPRPNIGRRSEARPGASSLLSPVASSTPVRNLVSPGDGLGAFDGRRQVRGGRGQGQQDLEPRSGLWLAWTAFSDFVWNVTVKLALAVRSFIATRSLVRMLLTESTDLKAAQWMVEVQPIVWGLEGLALLTVAAVVEEKKGIVRYHVGKIINSFLRLKRAVAEAPVLSVSTVHLYKVPGLCQASLESKVRSGLTSAVNDALGLIGHAYSKDLKNMRLTQEQLSVVEKCQERFSFSI